MFELPPVPSWEGLHPLIIHFPIALLMVAPVFILVGTFVDPKRGRAFLIAALILLVLGTGSLFVAVSTGEAAGERAEANPAVSAVLEDHEELAETSRAVFSVLTVVLALIILVPAMLKRGIPRKAYVALPIVFLIFYGAGVLLLANTAHQGGRLVHEFGVRAMTGTAPAPSTGDAAAAEERDEGQGRRRGGREGN